MTASEQKLWRELRKLDRNFRRQSPIGRYFADFASHGLSLVIEVDGGVHERFPEVALKDAERQGWLEGQGYRVIRFTDRQVTDDIEHCVEVVRGFLKLPDADVLDRDIRTSAPSGDTRCTALGTPPSPTLPPSRRKGA